MLMDVNWFWSYSFCFSWIWDSDKILIFFWMWPCYDSTWRLTMSAHVAKTWLQMLPTYASRCDQIMTPTVHIGPSVPNMSNVERILSFMRISRKSKIWYFVRFSLLPEFSGNPKFAILLKRRISLELLMDNVFWFCDQLIQSWRHPDLSTGQTM